MSLIYDNIAEAVRTVSITNIQVGTCATLAYNVRKSLGNVSSVISTSYNIFIYLFQVFVKFRNFPPTKMNKFVFACNSLLFAYNLL